MTTNEMRQLIQQQREFNIRYSKSLLLQEEYNDNTTKSII